MSHANSNCLSFPTSHISAGRQYLAFCVRAARRHGKTVYENFLDANLVDRKTTVREHLEADPTIMAEPPAAHYDPDGSLTREVDKLFEKDRAASD